MSSDLLRDLQRLSGAIDRHKSGNTNTNASNPNPHTHRTHTFVNAQYKPNPAPKYQRPPTNPKKFNAPSTTPLTSPKKEVVIGGVAFTSSKHKLTRKDAPASSINKGQKGSPTSKPPSWSASSALPWKARRNVGSHRAYKPKFAGNRVLNNTEKSQTLRRARATLKARRSAKQCPFFSVTGMCARGQQCQYQHDPKKIAICPRYMRRECPYTADNCLLSHESTPERVSLCIHFANQGYCKSGEDCLYPHFNVGPRSGVCRDFAVLGYCEKGINCDKQHLRECPTFAEVGKCDNPKCRLPHVIRANARRKQDAPLDNVSVPKEKPNQRYGISFSTMAPESLAGSEVSSDEQPNNLLATHGSDLASGDYIPLTFEESSGSESEDEDEEMQSDHGGGGSDNEQLANLRQSDGVTHLA